MGAAGITIRRADDGDLPAILEVASAALGWSPGEPHEAFFRWKHLDNPFGPSPMWVAESDGRLAGFRAFMRWELERAGGYHLRAVRAVDTATHPDFQRRGIFTRLTEAGLAEMVDEGVDIVFNTPNAQSRPGYLKMGWVDVDRLPVAFRPTGPLEAVRMARARTAAQKWSLPSTVGVDAGVLWADDRARATLGVLLRWQPAPVRWATPLDVEVVSWRYGLEPLRYRAWVGPSGTGSVSEGVVLFRLRRRGGATECVVARVLAPDGEPRRVRRLLAALARRVDADYLIRLGGPDLMTGFVPLPGQGPRLTVRKVCTAPPVSVDEFALHMGDIELF